MVRGSHVFDSSAESVCRGVSVERFFAESKVSQYHVSLAVEHDVLRFQISARHGEKREEGGTEGGGGREGEREREDRVRGSFKSFWDFV